MLIGDLNYTAWGEVRYSSGTTPANYTYTGQYSHVADFGLMYYNARWYDPSLGRFAQADSIVPAGVQGYDRYAYVNNNPLRYTDPTGHMCSDPEDPTPSCDEADNVGDKSNGGGNEEDGIPLTPYTGPCVSVVCLPASTPQPTLPISPIIPTNVPQYSVPSTTFDDLVNYWEFSFDAHDILHTMQLAENYGRPVYKHVKYSVSLLGVEYGADAAFQLYDDRNKNINIPQRVLRAGIRGGESFITDGASQFVGGLSAIGTGSPLGYFAGAYFTSGILDNLATYNLNPLIFNYLGGP